MVALPPVDFLSQTLIVGAGVGLVTALIGGAERLVFHLPDEPGEVLLAPREPDPLPSPDAGLTDQGPIRTFHYTWDFRPPIVGGKAPRIFTIDLPISEVRYQKYSEEPRQPDPEKWTRYANTPMPELDLLAAKFLQLHLKARFGPLDQATNVLAFAQQCVTYEYDEVIHPGQPEYPQYPIESLYLTMGDCEDHAILAAALMAKLGFEAALILVPGHCALGLACAPGVLGDGYVRDPNTSLLYYYGETTAAGWQFGQVPNDLRGSAMKVLPIRFEVPGPSTADDTGA